MALEKERELFEQWFVTKYPYTSLDRDNGVVGTYWHERVEMSWQSWLSSIDREGYKLVPVEMSRQKANEMSNKHWRDYQYSHAVYQQGQSATALSIESARINWCRNKAHEIMREYKTLMKAAS